jgi:hypothetical protein
MKTLGLVFGVLAASLSCTAQSSSGSVTESNKFVICQDGKPFSKITISGVRPGEALPETQKLFIEDGRRLQRYFHLLSGCQIPIENVDPMPKDQSMPSTIYIDLTLREQDCWCAQISIRKEFLFIRDTQPRSGEMMRDGRIVRVELPHTAGKQALDEFGQKCFGVPVSAIDDPNYKWPEKKPTLVIDIDKFEPIVHPRKPAESPKRPNQ